MLKRFRPLPIAEFLFAPHAMRNGDDLVNHDTNSPADAKGQA